MTWTKLFGFVAVVAAGFASIFRARGKQHQAEAREQKSRAETADAALDVRERVDENRGKVTAKHRQEDSDASAHSGRNGLDNSW